MQSGQILGIIGAVLIFVGVFMPIVSIPLWGSINLFQIEETLAVALILLAAAHLILSVQNIWWGLWLSKAGVILALGYVVYSHWSQLTGHSTFLGSLVKQVTKVHWGTGVLMAGILILLSASVPKPERKKNRQVNAQHAGQPVSSEQ